MGNLMNETLKSAVAQWLQRDPDPQTRAELEGLDAAGDTTELTQRFAGRLTFGTAGLRAVVGAGPMRINRLVVRETSAGLGDYLLSSVANAASRGVVVAYDGRLDSEIFAQDAAAVFAAQGLRVYLTEAPTATPLGAFAVIQRGAAAGVVITASHNPPEYNGYKVYWENGVQIIPPHDRAIAAAIVNAAQREIPWLNVAEARAEGRIEMLGEDFYRTYCDTVVNSPLLQNTADTQSISIAYTAMHGVGASVAETLLERSGFNQVYSVASQREPDGNFPTVHFPNPEEPGAMDAVIALARQRNATLACANDPDADRLAVAARTAEGDYKILSGDQVGALLGDYFLSDDQLPQWYRFSEHRPAENRLTPVVCTPIVCTTIVSSSLLKPIAEAAGAHYCETLTGFKWLINTALDKQDKHSRLLFAYEESLGYAVGDSVRDKDGLSALLAFTRMTAALAEQGKTVWDQLEMLYRRYGLFCTAQRSIALPPGSASISTAMRKTPPETVAGYAVEVIEDLQNGLRQFADGHSETIDLPRSDVLIYRLENRGRIVVRPSGTEPKLKCYYEIVETIAADEPFATARQRGESRLTTLLEKHQKSVVELS